MNGHLGILVKQWPSDTLNNERDRFKADGSVTTTTNPGL